MEEKGPSDLHYKNRALSLKCCVNFGKRHSCVLIAQEIVPDKKCKNPSGPQVDNLNEHYISGDFWTFLLQMSPLPLPRESPLLSTHSMRPEINQKLKFSIQFGFTGVVTYHVTNLNIQVNQSQNEKLNNYFAIKEQISQSRI